jgi:hypothetical protein
MPQELPITKEIKEAERAMELARIWVADKRQVFIISPNLWDDPATWGMLLVDLAKHVARAYEGRDPEQVLDRIRAGFDAEWDHPTE